MAATPLRSYAAALRHVAATLRSSTAGAGGAASGQLLIQLEQHLADASSALPAVFPALTQEAKLVLDAMSEAMAALAASHRLACTPEGLLLVTAVLEAWALIMRGCVCSPNPRTQHDLTQWVGQRGECAGGRPHRKLPVYSPSAGYLPNSCSSCAVACSG
jgi:hypothetical protein